MMNDAIPCYINSVILYIIGLCWDVFKGLCKYLSFQYVKTGIFLLFTLWYSPASITAHAGIPVQLEIIREIESSGRADAVGPSGERGLYQVSEILRKEYNQFHKKQVSPEELFLPEINERIADWYLHERIPALLRHFKKPVTLENIIVAYNAGIATVAHSKPLPPITKAYIQKYKRIQARGNSAQRMKGD
jgi:hypothetical protein